MYDVALDQSYFPAQQNTEGADRTIGDMLRDVAKRSPGAIALKELSIEGAAQREWTFEALLHDAERLARALASRHESGARIAVFANNVPEWILLELGAAMAGVTLVTVNPAFQKRELDYVLKQSRAEAIYYVESFRGNPIQSIANDVCDGIPAIKNRILLSDHDSLFAGEDVGELRAPKPTDPAQIQYTSGTTGFPKGALLHHKGLVRNGTDVMIRNGLRAGDCLVHHMPLFHTTGCGVVAIGALATGATMLLPPAFDPDMVISVIERERCKMIIGVPTMLVALIESVKKSGKDISSVKRIMSGGAMVAPQLCIDAQKYLGAPVQIVYGQTESSPALTQTWFEDSFEDLTETIGQPAPHTELSIRNLQTNEVLPIGEQGEICGRAYSVMLGYNDNPDATAAAIDEDGWLHTGDLGRMDARGYVTITGRVKEMIIRGGENLFPVEIENALLEHELIDETAVVGVPDDKWGEQVVCFVRSGSDVRLSAEDLKSFVRDRLSPQKTPAYWVRIDEWPLTGSGKIQKFKLAEEFTEGHFEALR